MPRPMTARMPASAGRKKVVPRSRRSPAASQAQTAVNANREAPRHIRVTEEEKQRLTAAADREHLSLSVWARLAMLQAAKLAHKCRIDEFSAAACARSDSRGCRRGAHE